MISGFGVALIAVFWAFDGWVYITWVAGEIKNPQKVLPRAMLLGILLVGFIYMSVSVVYLYALPITQVANETTIAQAAAVALFSSNAAKWLGATIALSCFGAASSAILCSARVTYAMARDGAFFHAMGTRASQVPNTGLQPDRDRVPGRSCWRSAAATTSSTPTSCS